jgi:AcrR family transcriptional regulator
MTTDAEIGSELAPPQTTRVARKHNKRRGLILEAAAIVFAEMGYHRASLEDIAERLDLTRASLYHYFPSKDALLSSCLEFGAEQAISRLEETAREKSGDATARLGALIVTQLDTICREAPELSRLFLTQMDWPDGFRGQIKGLRDRHDKCFRTVINEGIASGEFLAPDPEVARHCMHGAINYAPVWLRRNDPKFDARVEAIATSLVLLLNPAGSPSTKRRRAKAAVTA